MQNGHTRNARRSHWGYETYISERERVSSCSWFCRACPKAFSRLFSRKVVPSSGFHLISLDIFRLHNCEEHTICHYCLGGLARYIQKGCEPPYNSHELTRKAFSGGFPKSA